MVSIAHFYISVVLITFWKNYIFVLISLNTWGKKISTKQQLIRKNSPHLLLSFRALSRVYVCAHSEVILRKMHTIKYNSLNRAKFSLFLTKCAITSIFATQWLGIQYILAVCPHFIVSASRKHSPFIAEHPVAIVKNCDLALVSY